MNPKNFSIVSLNGAYRIMSRKRAISGRPRNIHRLSKETYKSFEEAGVAIKSW